MNDHSSRTILTLIATSTLSLAATLLWNALPVARARSTPVRQKCVWTYIIDRLHPSIGENGVVDLKGKDWKKVSADGWTLKAADGQRGLYMFERCE